jgi:lysophospholipase L1-like esterase
MKYLFIIYFLFISYFSTSQEYKNQWEKEMKLFDSLDRNSPAQKVILFTGSSTIRLWKNPEKDFNNPTIINRGFGGSQLIDLIENFDQIILKYHPTKIVIYSGDNDIGSGKSAEIVFGDFCTLYGMLKAKLPNAKIYYLAIKPCMSRWNKVPEVKKANAMIDEFLRTKTNSKFVDVFSPMIGLDGKPKKEYFLADSLHMNETGYKLWTEILTLFIF